MKPLSFYKSLSDAAGRREAGCFLVEGKRAVDQLLVYHRGAVVELLLVDGLNNDIVDTGCAGVPVRFISPANMKAIASSRAPQGIAAAVRMPEGVYTSDIPASSFNNSQEPSPSGNILLLEDVQDPGNAGTLIRTAAAFGYSGVIMSGKCADAFSPKAVQSTAGSLLSLWIRRSGDYLGMADRLKRQGYKLIAADLDGEDISVNNISSLVNTDPHVLILGNEGAGLSAELLDKCDKRVRIPIVSSGAESLNVAVSGGVMMFLTRR